MSLVLATGVLWIAACGALQATADDLAARARRAWDAARAAATAGGSADSLAPARAELEALDAAAQGTPWQLPAAYAHSLIAAAMAAAQDERPEMALHLTHARSLAERLNLVSEPARWPLGIDEAAGELWLEVDDYEQAVGAFERAVKDEPRSPAWLGLARAAARLPDVPRACEAYGHWVDSVAESPRAAGYAEAIAYLARCP